MAEGRETLAVVTGDIVKSRLYAPRDRQRLQKVLLTSWKRVNRFYSAEFESTFSFRITAGDEFQYVCRSFAAAVQSLTMLRLHLRAAGFSPPVTIRAAIGLGTRSVAGTADSYTQDGPAFRHAREGIERLDRNRLHPLTMVQGLPEPRQRLTNDVLALSDRTYVRWTTAQAQVLVYAAALKMPGEIAQTLDISEAAVSTHLRRASWREYAAVIASVVEDAPFVRKQVVNRKGLNSQI
jgi:DNA-binding CsgD family transcriptional regulator